MDWVDPIVSESVEEREENISNLIARFSARMPSELRTLKGKLPLTPKYQATSAQNGLV